MANNFLDNTLLTQLWTKCLNTFAMKGVTLEYNSTTAYVPGNVVYFNSMLYLCLSNTTGHSPTDTDY